VGQRVIKALYLAFVAPHFVAKETATVDSRLAISAGFAGRL
jgi:hypothetical protein